MNLISRQSKKQIIFELLRIRARLYKYFKKSKIQSKKLHFGCGNNKINGWLNVDLTDSDLIVDLACGVLPFPNEIFSVAVSQHVIEHLYIENELLPLLKEINRTLEVNGELWLSCPDMEKICNEYLKNKGQDLLADRLKRYPDFSIGELPTQQIINDLFHQNGEHKNLFDFELLKWVLIKSNFRDVVKVNEKIFNDRFPEFPHRNDDFVSLYIKAIK
ncbi:class I SAM-dependent methyltransferase [Rhabdobacter roseus]|nr:methyltransferase domain-containing protein [Rhabdobacter roseus]